MIELALGDKADLAEIGKAKRKETEGRPSKETVVTNDSSLPKHDTRKEVAKTAGVSTGQVAKAEIVKRDAPDLWEKAKAQEVTIGAAYKQVTKKRKAQERDAHIAHCQRANHTDNVTVTKP